MGNQHIKRVTTWRYYLDSETRWVWGTEYAFDFTKKILNIYNFLFKGYFCNILKDTYKLETHTNTIEICYLVFISKYSGIIMLISSWFQHG